MSIFGKIKDAIFGKPAPAKEPPARARTGNAYADAPTVAPSRPQQTTVINIENSFDSMPGADRLNWRTSIVDLMKLIGVDSDYESRKALATEMGREDYSGSTQDNVWLHQRVMQELASNGGEVPESLR
ncbi:MAG: DUF3597 domain-containing protein [Qipengyuania sp.]|nr:DUF3597 domain-containing protein [Qipengyuania sp.]